MILLITPYVLLTFGLLASVALFIALKIEVQKNARKHRRRIDEMAAKIEETAARALAEPPPAPAIPHLKSGFNLSKRFQAMRMLRRGEDVAHIAAALGVSHREVELLIRVQTIGASTLAKQASTSGS